MGKLPMPMNPKAPPVSASDATSLELQLPESDPRSLVGQLVADRYEVQELLGIGGMGCVYRARHVHIRKTVALKTLHASMLGSSEAVARFEREAVAAARIDHPNVVVATDFGHLANGRYYLVLEFVQGRDLRSELDEQTQIAIPRALTIARQIASALSAAHALGIVHRDLKPENVMLVERAGNADLVKVLDFGIAKITLEDKNQPLTQLGAIFGTPQYMSPEQAKGEPVDGRSDLYSLGIILYEMLTGKLPFEAADALGFIVQHLNGTPSALPTRIPEPLRQLVEALLEKVPANRPASAAAVVAHLDQLTLLLGASRSFSPLQHARRWLHWGRDARAKLAPILKQKHRVGRLELSISGWLLFGSIIPAILFFFLMRREPVDSRSASVATGAGAPSAVVESALPTLSDAEFTQELDRIEQLKVYQRSERDWMLLARGSAKLARHEQSVMAYQALLSLRADLRKDAGLLTDLLTASEDPKAFRVVLNLAETVLGKYGVDLIWEMWQRERYLPDRKEQAEKLSKKLVILSRQASPALRIAIELTFTNHCEKLLATLGRAATEADARSSSRLSELNVKSGCGADRDEDCFSCLRESPLLTQALDKAKETRAPSLGSAEE